jgi:hypothetical protein
MSSSVMRTLEMRHEGDPMGLLRAKGNLCTRTGFMVSMIARNDPDDPAKIEKLRQAAVELEIHL